MKLSQLLLWPSAVRGHDAADLRFTEDAVAAMVDGKMLFVELTQKIYSMRETYSQILGAQYAEFSSFKGLVTSLRKKMEAAEFDCDEVKAPQQYLQSVKQKLHMAVSLAESEINTLAARLKKS